MRITDRFVLHPDLTLTPASLLDPDQRARAGCAITDVVVTKARSRRQSKVIGADLADLLGRFRSPVPIVAALADFARDHGQDPLRLLEESFAALTPFIDAGWLSAEDAAPDAAIAPGLQPGDRIAGYHVVACHQLIEDSEVYLARDRRGDPVALKIARNAADARVGRQLRNERDILTQLGGTLAPRLIEGGVHRGLAWLATPWLRGSTVDVVAADLRLRPGAERQLGELAVAVAVAYADLHDRGVVHGDVYPRNILAEDQRTVRLLDFGVSTRAGRPLPDGISRKGSPEYYDPQFAAALREGRPPPAPTIPSDQYALAAVLWFLLSGTSYLDFAYGLDDLLRQVVEDEPRAFHPRPGLERFEPPLRRALMKDPDQRFGSVRDLAEALTEVLPTRTSRPRPGRLGQVVDAARGWLDALRPIESMDPPGDLPTASVTHGAAGVAAALLQRARREDDPRLLEAADAWLCRAEADLGQERAFHSVGLELDAQRVGPASVYYGAPGVHLVRALIAQAMGDERNELAALRELHRAARLPSSVLDLTMGLAGLLHGATLVAVGHPDGSGPAGPAAGLLGELGEVAGARLQAGIRTDGMEYLGMAHGMAGALFAALSWNEAVGGAVPGWCEVELDALAARAQPHGRGVRWPMRTAASGHQTYMESWCHGGPGMVYLWLAAARSTGRAAYLDLAEQAGWAAWEEQRDGGTLCCGAAGKGFALLRLAGATGDRAWTDRAVALAERAWNQTCDPVDHHASLFQGRVGAALLLTELGYEGSARFPLFDAG